ncbi:hypothetical protein [Allorhodopirellula heiligendammensis]|uniref:hypothetical protein n=1 Tax=Allorhodopirellula heiligendammensis TaxID=2714739 RepID=UPI00265E3155|nr:hypothetical protein [Allorhodopirellula heiligendammensis]
MDEEDPGNRPAPADGDGDAGENSFEDGWNEEENWGDVGAWLNGEYGNENGGSNNEQP